jgi:hypothetical protein
MEDVMHTAFLAARLSEARAILADLTATTTLHALARRVIASWEG